MRPSVSRESAQLYYDKIFHGVAHTDGRVRWALCPEAGIKHYVLRRVLVAPPPWHSASKEQDKKHTHMILEVRSVLMTSQPRKPSKLFPLSSNVTVSENLTGIPKGAILANSARALWKMRKKIASFFFLES